MSKIVQKGFVSIERKETQLIIGEDFASPFELIDRSIFIHEGPGIGDLSGDVRLSVQ